MPLKSISVSNFRCFRELNIPPDGTQLSPGINLFIGPNGSGKTSLFNLIRLTVGREPLNSQMEFMVGSTRVGTSSWVHDFNQPDKPWSAKATFELNDGNAELLVASVELEAGKSGGDQRQLIRKLNDKLVGREPLGCVQGLLRNRVFHMGWPRIVSKLSGSRAFEPVLEDQDSTLTNPEAFRKAWQRVRAAALQYLEIPDLGEAPQTGPEVFGGALLDQNRRPLLENSDGVCHALYLIVEIEKHPWPTTFLIEEPDTYLHPGLQRRFMDYLESRCGGNPGGNPSEATAAHQFLVTTHSPYLINAVTEMSGRRNPPHRLFQMTREGRTVSVKSIRDNHDQWATLAAIGHRSADVLLPNGLIWVEGPSDIIYLKVWLSKYAGAQQRKIVWGRDAEILWYGGNQWAHMGSSWRVWSGMDDEGYEKLLNVLKINPNAVVVMDKDEGLLSPKAPSKYKAKLRRELLEHDQLVWVTEPKCIELYIPATADADEGLQATFSECRDIENTRNKVNRAQSYMMKTEQHSWKDIVDLSTDIESQLKNVFERICCWAGHSKSISSA